MTRLRRTVWALMLISLPASLVCADTIVLRGGQVLEEPVVGMDVGGLQIGGDAPRTIGWDAVRSITGASAGQAEAFADLSERAWRARVRLDRNDIELATPLFVALNRECGSASGPTALLAAEGLARCRLARGENAAAVEPWLDSLRLRRLGARLAGELDLVTREPWVVRRPLADGETLLVPELPPMWLDGPEVDTLAQQLEATSASDSGIESRYHAWYALAATWESTHKVDHGAMLNLSAESLSSSAPKGERLVAAIVVARLGDPAERSAARAVLDSIIAESLGTWQEAWARVGLGRSLLLESDPVERDRGLVHLLHAPARFQASMPALSALALAEAGRETALRGATASSQRIHSELAALATSHAAAEAAQRWLSAAVATSGEESR